MRLTYLAAMALLLATPAAAQDRLVDVAIPEGVAQIMREEGYKAVVKTRENGSIHIEGAQGKWTFEVDFYSCHLVKGCESLQFYAWYKREPGYTLERINLWNSSKRFLKVAIDKDDNLETTMDVSLVGKTTYANFADTLDWWSVMSSDLFDFLDKKPDAETKPPAKP